MATEQTLCIIKPNAMKPEIIGNINTMLRENGIRIVAQQCRCLTRPQARIFYAEHRNKPFFESLVAFMASGPVFLQILEGENAIGRYRELMGATDPAQAAEGTIRSLFGNDKEANAVHGSADGTGAKREIAFFHALAAHARNLRLLKRAFQQSLLVPRAPA